MYLDNFITIKTFTYPSELAILRSRLEAEGIECRVLDELTAQVNPFYADAIGGVKLQVKESYVARTIEILKENGYLNDEVTQPSQIVIQLENTTSRIPFLNKLRLELRLMILIGFVVSLISGITYVVTLPSTFEQLTEQYWCVDQIMFKGKKYATNTHSFIQPSGMGFCQESIGVNINGIINLPGFNSFSAKGKWILEGDTLYINKVDTFGFVYNGYYHVKLSGNTLILESENTRMNCHSENINFSF
ncbi:MAG: hypothetical protein ACJAUV_000366 [Flavobacteriales bacterium]